MSNFALAYSGGRAERRQPRLVVDAKRKAPRPLRPWSEVSVAGTTVLEATSGHPKHIRHWHFAAVIVFAVALHAGLAWYVNHYGSQRTLAPIKSELSIEIIRPPKPETPKVEPPKPQPPKPQPKQAQVLPQIQQAVSEPQSVGVATEAPIAVAPIVSAPPPAPESLPVTAPIGRAGYLNNPAPEYPQQASRQGWQGTVLLHVRVLSDGKVESVEVKHSSGRKVLDEEAIRTVKKWLFTPSKRGDTPVDGWATVPIEFLLD